MYGQSNMENYITICKIDSYLSIVYSFFSSMAQEAQTGALYQPRGVGCGGRGEGR